VGKVLRLVDHEKGVHRVGSHSCENAAILGLIERSLEAARR
jgi:hypothetical protein